MTMRVSTASRSASTAAFACVCTQTTHIEGRARWIVYIIATAIHACGAWRVLQE